MSLTIWKYQVPVQNGCRLEMPDGAQILSLQEQAGQVCLWALVDPAAQKKQRIFRVFGTGNRCDLNPPTDSTFIGTVQDGPFVWHVFERVAK